MNTTVMKTEEARGLRPNGAAHNAGSVQSSFPTLLAVVAATQIAQSLTVRARLAKKLYS
jgi:hypothetical protein